MPRQIRKNTIRTLRENRDSEDEISYEEIATACVAEITPGVGVAATCGVIALLFLVCMVVLFKLHKSAILSKNTIQAENIEIFYQSDDGVSRTLPIDVEMDLRQEVVERLEKKHKISEFLLVDERLIPHMRETFQEHPWVKRVCSIEKFYPPYMKIVVELRQPGFIAVFSDNKILPVANDGVILPSIDFPQNSIPKYPLVFGFETLPLCRVAGVKWDDPRVEKVLQLLRDIGSNWAPLNLREIHLETVETGAGAALEFKLYTQNGSCIAWGAADSSSPHEIPSEHKIKRLLELQQNGSLNSPDAPQNVSFRRKTQ
ncbi:MAG: hypothetical protein Q4D38_03230 [Planctomycetia bacterium]|nr:hypothetical protein [Planctomycetia bacterium]